MPRAEVGTPKWLANKMKSKGLQKLKWYCQMCEKQCRDENGFKCHRLSEGHQRMMQVFVQNSGRFMDGFSRTFEGEFMKLMRTRYRKTKILANTVYQELISDKQHVHMNATIWVTLSEFVLYLGRSGKCKVEHTPKGWYIEYIDQEELKRQEDERAKMKREITLEQMHQRLIQKLIQEAKERGEYDQQEEYTPLMKDPEEKIVINTNMAKEETTNDRSSKKQNVFKEFYQKSKQTQTTNKDKDNDKEREDKHSSKRKSTLEWIMEQNQKKSRHQGNFDKHKEEDKEPSQKSETWLSNGIVVKVILKSHDMYKQKFKVLRVTRDVATLETDNGTLEIKDKYLETVIPATNNKVKVLAGKNKGLVGTLVSSDPDNLRVSVSLQGNLVDLTYDEVSQYVP